MAQKRLATVLNVSESKVWGSLFEETAFNTVWGSTDKTPREVLRLTCQSVLQAIENGHAEVTEDDLRDSCRAYSERLLDALCSRYQYECPGIQFVLQRFAGGPKEFDVNHIQEVAFTIADAVQSGLHSDTVPWATCGVERPTEFAQPLLRAGLLLLKDGRSSHPRVPTEHDLQLLNDSSWFSVCPRFHAGLGLLGT